MADVIFNCIFCNESLIVDEAGIGLEVPCPYCLHKQEIPASADRVEDPESIIELEAPETSPETADAEEPAVPTTEDDAGEELADLVNSAELEDLSPDNAETVLALLESLLDEPVAPKGKQVSEKQLAPILNDDGEKTVGRAIEDLKSRIDGLQNAYQDADHKVEELSHENSELKSRIQHEEHEREDLAAKLAHYTQKIEVDTILNDLETSTGMEARLEGIRVKESPKARWSYPVFAGLLCVLAFFLLVSLYKVTVGVKGGGVNPPDTQKYIRVKNILLGDSEYVNGIRLIAYEARIASAVSMGIEPERLEGASHCLVINITLQNTLRDKNVYLAKLWEESRLSDDLGNHLKRLAYRVNRDDDSSSDPAKVVLKPTEMVDTIIIFKPPVSSAKTFVMTCRPGFWLEASDGYEPITENQFSLKFNRTEIATVANK